MSASNYYWTQSQIDGFGKMWFLIAPQEADSSGGGKSLLGSVVNEIPGRLFPSSGGIIGKSFPVPEHMTERQLLLKLLQEKHTALGIDLLEIVQEINYPGLNVSFEKKKVLKTGVGGFPSVPVSFSIDYARMSQITIEFGSNTRKLYIPPRYLGKLKDFVGGDDKKIDPSGIIDKETIVHQLLLTDRYSVVFESEEAFQPQFEVALEQANLSNAGKITFELNNSTKKQVTVTVNDGKEYLIALKDIDWDDF